jgi:enediyne polyketide synthase
MTEHHAGDPIAIVGLACHYPDADSPDRLWSNVLHRRRAFRQIPAARLLLADYHSPDRDAPDRTYSGYAAVLDDWEFDRGRFRVPGAAFRAADLTHWLALDVASRVLADAGYPDGNGLPADRTGVVLGNSLTGEFTRSAVTLRLRWPYVRRVLDQALSKEDWDDPRRAAFLAALEEEYKRPFAPIGDESLAGALSNTIAGRICNHYDLHGGGFTVDAACASSLLAVATACAALRAGDLDFALAGGVDLSLDPFELVGFAKTGALAGGEMRVYDRRSDGFWPGEGCGIVALMRAEDAAAADRRVYATIAGWGISSDGAGGLTRPEAGGQLLAVQRAYRRAGYDAGTVDLFEGHGTGTAVGDQIELTVLTRARRDARPDGTPAALGSIKANIGHTKAAAGTAGLLKAALSVHHATLPPVTGCEEPHPLLTEESPVLRVLADPEEWTGPVRRAGVSAMGFGGINTHLTIQSVAAASRRRGTRAARAAPSVQPDCELVVVAAADRDGLREQLVRLERGGSELSFAELTDLSVAALAGVPAGVPYRAGFVADGPAALVRSAGTALRLLDSGSSGLLSQHGVFLGAGDTPARVTLLFPGQGSPVRRDAGLLGRLCPELTDPYADAALAAAVDLVDTARAQPGIVRGSLAGVAVLDALGVAAEAAVGHSVGEITGLCWAGCLDEAATLGIVAARGAAMSEYARPHGAMASVGAGEPAVAALLTGTAAVVAGLNSSRQTVVSGNREDVSTVLRRAAERGYPAVPLPVSHAFHSPEVAAAADALGRYLRQVTFQPSRRRLFSTVTGTALDPAAGPVELAELLVTQVTAPVRFAAAIEAAAPATDLFVEVGPGTVLRGLAAQCCTVPAVATDVGSRSGRELFTAVAALFAAGQARDLRPLTARRFARAFDPGRRRLFLANPCEQASVGVPAEPAAGAADVTPPYRVNGPAEVATDPLRCVRDLLAEAVELPVGAVAAHSRLLSDLHLNSLRVAQIAASACDRLGRARPTSLTGFGDVSVGELAAMLSDLPAASADGPAEAPPGVAHWVRAFLPGLVARERPRTPVAGRSWRLSIAAGHPLAGPIRAAFGPGDDVGEGAPPAVLAALPPAPAQAAMVLLLSAAQAAAETGTEFVVLQHGGGGSAIAKTLHAERPELDCTVLDVPATADGVRWAAEEARHPRTGFREVHFDSAGRRLVPTLVPLPLPPVRAGDRMPIDAGDVLLVGGGGKGIGFECAAHLARVTGAALLLLGRSDPDADPELAGNLARLSAIGTRFSYLRADLTDAGSVAAAVAIATLGLGPVTALLHSAGTNRPQRLPEISPEDLSAHLGPKLTGLDNLLAAVDPERLKLVVTFGSIIGRMGLAGEAHYAAANELLALRVGRLAAELPHCRCLNLEWSVWSGAGMGERLGATEALARAGVTPIPVEAGTDHLDRLLALAQPAGTVVVTGRYGAGETLLADRPEPPLSRFLERPLLHYPGVELVAEADLSVDIDRYLADHALGGVPMLPAVVGLEAMAQAAAAVSGRAPATGQQPVQFTDIRLDRPITVPADGKQTVRVAVLARDDGAVDVVLRSAETGFAASHASGRVAPAVPPPAVPPPAALLPVSEVPGRDDRLTGLYGGLLFHGPRFRRLRRIERLDARHCTAWIDASGWDDWFGGYHSTRLLLGDPGARDTFIHMNQCCIPHRRVLPVAVARIIGYRQPQGVLRAEGVETGQIGDEYVYQVTVTDESGALCELWHGLRLRDVDAVPAPARWLPEVFGAYLQRRAEELAGVRLDAVSVTPATGARTPGRSAGVAERILEAGSRLHYRADGRPLSTSGQQVSISHLPDWTLVVAARAPIGCDWEPVADRSPAEWATLLGPAAAVSLAELLTRETSEPFGASGTRVWTAMEALAKVGRAPGTPLTLRSVQPDGWVVLDAGDALVVSGLAALTGVAAPVAVALLIEPPG